MAMNGVYLDLLASAGAAAITHIGLVNAGGTEISGGSPAYARQAVTWEGPTAGDGLIRPDEDLDFDIPSGVTVGGWRGYSASAGGTDFGGEDVTNQPFATQGVYTLLAASTAIDNDVN